VRKVLFFFLAFLVLRPALAEPRPYGFAEARNAFYELDSTGKATFQVMMTAAGYWAQIPRLDYSLRLFADTQRFQGDLGHRRTGILTEAEIDRLLDLAIPNLRYWGFAEMAHPSRGRPIWVPMGIGGRIVPVKNGVWFEGNGVEIKYLYLPRVGLREVYDYMLAKLSGEGKTIVYRVMRKGFFAISSEKDGASQYLRYHQDGAGLLGFTMYWENNDAPLHGGRVATLVSGSLSSQMLGTPMIAVPRFDVDRAPRVASPRALPPDRDAGAQTAPKRKSGFSSGTGFFVTKEGHIVTNSHVVEGCARIHVVAGQGESIEARAIATDETNDLALLVAASTPRRIANLRATLRLGEPVAAFGYPHRGVLASSGNFTLGNVTALAGMHDDTRFVQVSSPVQPGNSGGPLLDENGNVVGVVTAKLDAIKTVQITGDLPQNVNFALKASIVAGFLDANRIDYLAGSATSPLKPEDIADEARSISVFIQCQ
jgi:S1-C subfamily serine protease